MRCRGCKQRITLGRQPLFWRDVAIFLAILAATGAIFGPCELPLLYPSVLIGEGIVFAWLLTTVLFYSYDLVPCPNPDKTISRHD
ncbi:MAG: hypothetical protein P4L46_23745 [Fimbriimonas sp.]|nr:hypothetical protein [Fimbriimonas sp.]